MKEELTLIRITMTTGDKIRGLAKTLKLKQITVLEYLLNGKIDLEKLKEQNGLPKINKKIN